MSFMRWIALSSTRCQSGAEGGNHFSIVSGRSRSTPVPSNEKLALSHLNIRISFVIRHSTFVIDK
jgi:hypothetical protein